MELLQPKDGGHHDTKRCNTLASSRMYFNLMYMHAKLCFFSPQSLHVNNNCTFFTAQDSLIKSLPFIGVEGPVDDMFFLTLTLREL